MKLCALLSLLAIGCLCVGGAPVEQEGMKPGSCQDPSAVAAAGLALTKINEDRQQGYIFSLQRLSNVNTMSHGETGTVYYLTLDVLDTDCHVLSRKDWKTCTARSVSSSPAYGQCKATIYINRPHRVVRLYKYNCVLRPVPAAKVAQTCPDCPSAMDMDNPEILKTVSKSLEKFNKENRLINYFTLLSITRATAQMGIAEFYNVEYTIQETTCTKSTDAALANKCPLMDCEFAHKGFCKASHAHSMGGEEFDVDCEIFESEVGHDKAAEEERKLHLLGGETDHSHTDTHTAAVDHGHDHAQDHTKGHPGDSEHNHAHGSGHGHSHAHGQDHVHAHHDKAHDHSGDLPNQHHNYQHGDGVHTHEHDHEHALDHDHKHAHLHEHEHHHHHHGHKQEAGPRHRPEGMVRMLPAMDQPMTLPSFPDQPAGGPEVGVTLPLIPDPQIPGEREPTILPFPSSMSAECPAPIPEEMKDNLMVKVFAEDPMFKAAA